MSVTGFDGARWDTAVRPELLECLRSPSPSTLLFSLRYLNRSLSTAEVKTLKHLTGVCDESLTDD